jgi:hypothetical protein
MPSPYPRKYQKVIDDLYSIVLFCDLRDAHISDQRGQELLDWLWAKMVNKYREPPPHRTTGDWKPHRKLLIDLYDMYLAKYEKEKNPAGKAKARLMELYGLTKEAVEQAIYRARKKPKKDHRRVRKAILTVDRKTT